MPKTPFPWAVGNGCVIAPSVPYAESRWRASDEAHAKRMGRPRPTTFEYYGGELVAESCTFDDMVAIATTTRQVTLLLGFAQRIASQSTDELARQMATAALIVCASIEATVREEAKENHERDLYARETEYMQERAVIGLLPAQIEVPPADPYTPSHKFVTDNVELAHLARTRWPEIFGIYAEMPF